VNYNKLRTEFLVLVSGIMLIVYYIDVPLSVIISKIADSRFRAFFSRITVFGSFTFIFSVNIFLILLCLFRQYLTKNSNVTDEYKNLTKLVIFGALAQTFTAIIIQALKFLFGRMRPFYYLIHNKPNHQFTFLNFQYEFVSFPSGHSAGIWALITCLLIIFKKNKYSILLIIPGVLVSLSRLMLNLHFLSDILVGALLGIGLSLIFLKLIIKFLYKDRR